MNLFGREGMISGVGGLRGDPQFYSAYPAGRQGTELKETGRILYLYDKPTDTHLLVYHTSMNQSLMQGYGT